MIQYLQALLNHQDLSEETMREAMGTIMDGTVPPEQIAAFLVAQRMKGETVAEITGAARAMRERMHTVQTTRRPLVDTCGTGGDGHQTFNVSTAAAFVIAGCGVAVAKHHNRAVSSQAGSADVLTALGLHIEAPIALVQSGIETLGLGFLYAPRHHPATAAVAPVRRALGVRTMFNLLGPLTNPAQATHQLVGVFDKRWLVPLAQVLGNLGSTRAWVVHSEDGLDEISASAVTHVAEWDGSAVRTFSIAPEDAGMQRQSAAAVAGGDARHNAAIMQALLAGEHVGARDAVVLNAAAALVLCGHVSDLRAGVLCAQEALTQNKARDAWHKLAAHLRQNAPPGR